VKPPIDTPFFSLPNQEITPALNSMIHCADNYIRAAFYETTWESVVEAIEYRLSQDSDLILELVIDDDQCPRVNGQLMCPWSKIESDPRVTIVDDSRSKLMHHKFVIVDGQEVWVGSSNMTTNSLCKDVNDAIVINNSEIVLAFEEEFQRLFTRKEFGPIAPQPASTGGLYTVYFSPESPLTQPSQWFNALVDKIDAAQSSIEFMIFAFTRLEVSEALERAHLRGVNVRGLVSNQYANGAPAMALAAAGIELRKGRIHSKLMIVDAKTVIAGSANWSRSAWQNNETSIWMDDEGIASDYRAEFERYFGIATIVMP
jgi:phosphatidylserine/phosphatidylglycerophosphate/cardiolipin synthase-like enzyme